MTRYQVVGIGNAIVDVLSQTEDTFLDLMGITKGVMQLVERERGEMLYGAMRDRTEAPGGSVANTLAGLGNLGMKTAFVGRVRDDALGRFYARSLVAEGTDFPNPPVADAELPTSRSMIFVTPDGERSMNTYLGISADVSPADVPASVTGQTDYLFLEGYLFDKDKGKQAFLQAAHDCHAGGGKAGIALSDPFCVDRHRQPDSVSWGLVLIGAPFPDRADAAFGFARDANIPAVQDQPVMRELLELGGNIVLDGAFHCQLVAPGGDPGAVSDTKDVGVDGLRGLVEPHVQHDIRGLAPDARQGLQRGAAGRHLAVIAVDQHPAERDDVFGLVAEKAYGLDVIGQPCLTQRQHLLRCVCHREQRPRRLVHAYIRRLRRQGDGNDQGKGIQMLQLTLRLRLAFAKPGENRAHGGIVELPCHLPPMPATLTPDKH